MPKRLSKKIKIVPEKPQIAIKKLKKNGFVLKNKVGSHFYCRRRQGSANGVSRFLLSQKEKR